MVKRLIGIIVFSCFTILAKAECNQPVKPILDKAKFLLETVKNAGKILKRDRVWIDHRIPKDLIRHYSKIGCLEEAITLIKLNTEAPQDTVKKQMIHVYLKNNKYKEAVELRNSLSQPDNTHQVKKLRDENYDFVEYYIRQGQFEKAQVIVNKINKNITAMYFFDEVKKEYVNMLIRYNELKEAASVTKGMENPARIESLLNIIIAYINMNNNKNVDLYAGVIGSICESDESCRNHYAVISGQYAEVDNYKLAKKYATLANKFDHLVKYFPEETNKDKLFRDPKIALKKRYDKVKKCKGKKCIYLAGKLAADYAKVGAVQTADEIVKRYITGNPYQKVLAYHSVIESLANNNQLEQAIRLLQKRISDKHHKNDPLEHIVKALIKQNKFDEALYYADKITNTSHHTRVAEAMAKQTRDPSILIIWSKHLRGNNSDSNNEIYQILMTAVGLSGDIKNVIPFIKDIKKPILKANAYLGIAHGMLGEEPHKVR